MNRRSARPALYVVTDDHAFVHEAARGLHGEQAAEITRAVLMAAFAEGSLDDPHSIARVIREQLNDADQRAGGAPPIQIQIDP